MIERLKNILFVFVLVLLVIFSFGGCQLLVHNETDPSETAQQPIDERTLSVFELFLSDEAKEKAQAAYIQWYEKAYGRRPENVWIWEDTRTGVIQRFSNHCRYYGTFNDCVVWFSAEDWETPSSFELAGSSFSYGYSSDFHVYKDGEYYPLKLAYNQKLISAEDIAIIAQRHWNSGMGYRNYGIFGDCQIWLADHPNGEASEFELAGSQFKYKTGAVICVRKDERNYTLQEAYEKRWLTKEDVATVSKLHNEREQTFFELDLSEEMKTDIQKALSEWEKEYFKTLGIIYPLTELVWHDDAIYGNVYYGTFGTCVAWATIGSLDVVEDFTLAGSDFKNPTSAKFYIYRDGKHYALQEAYEQRLISAEDIAIIAERHAERQKAIFGKTK